MVTTTASASHLAPRYVSALSVGVTIDKAREIASQTPAFIPCPHVRLTLRSAAKLHSGRASSAASHCSTALLGPQPRRSARAAANSLGRSRSPKHDCPYCPSTEQ